MTILRQISWLRSAALVAAACLPAAAAAPHAHARRPLPTPLHTTSVTASHGHPRHPAAKAKSRSHNTGAAAPHRRGAAKAKPRTRRHEAAEPLVPLFHASHHPAPRGHQEAHLRQPPPPPPRQPTPRQPAPRQSEIFAQGFSHPDDDERLPLTASVSAAPPARSRTTIPQPQVIQGFGSELAVPPPTTRPGGTHRRPHPSNWVPEAMVPPQPLEEREAITEAAVSPVVLPALYDSNGRLMMPAPLKGSHDVLVHQNLMADSDGLERIQDDADLERLRAAHRLVGLPETESLRVNDEMPYNRRVARPWTALFAVDLSRAFFARFHEPLYITSAARTVHYQARLQRVNGNAAATSGEAASPHLTGQAIDFGKRGMSAPELAWMRSYLLPLIQAGKIDVEEEFQQACFHISVYRSYAAGRAPVLQQAHVYPTAGPSSILGSGAAQP